MMVIRHLLAPVFRKGVFFLIFSGWLGAVQAGSTSFRFEEDSCTLTIHTKKAGLMAFAGHEHLVQAQGISGNLELVDDDSTGNRVEVEVPLAALRVLDPQVSEKTRRQVQSSMESKVLPLESAPVARFAGGTFIHRDNDLWNVEGNLTFAGATRPVHLLVHLHRDGDYIHASGEGSLRLSDFSLPQVTALGGLVKVADVLEIGFTITAKKGKKI